MSCEFYFSWLRKQARQASDHGLAGRRRRVLRACIPAGRVQRSALRH